MKSRAYVEPSSAKHSVFTHIPKDPNCENACWRITASASCRRRAGTVVPRVEHFGGLITADHKILSEESEPRNNHRYVVVVQDSILLVQNKNYPRDPRRTWSEQGNQVIYTYNSLEFGKTCEELSWNHCTSTPHRLETHGFAERAARRVKEGTFAVLLIWHGWNGGRLLWNVSAICETFKTSCLMGRDTPFERRFEMPFIGPVVPFVAMVEYHPISAKDQSRLHQFGAKVLPGIVLGYALYAGESGKETLSRTLKFWRRWTHQNSTPEGSMPRKC